MNDSPTISICSVTAYGLWALAVATLVTMWVLMALGHTHTAVVMGFTSGTVAPAAGVATVRCYFHRLSRLVRLTAGIQNGPLAGPIELHPVP